MKKVLILMALFNLQASAYEYKRGEWLLKGILGKSVYFAQDTTTDINNNILTGLEVEHMLTPKWSMGGVLKPLFATNRVVLNFGVTGKYRFLHSEMPLVPYVSLGLIPSVLIPTDTYSKSHFNLGLRPAAGFEYFVARDLAIGIEAGMTPSLLFGKGTSNNFEASFEILAGATWRL